MDKFICTNLAVMILWFSVYCNARHTTLLASFGCLLSGMALAWCICWKNK